MHTGPVILGFDGTPVSVRAVREAAALLAPRPALAVVVWEAGRTFEAATLPEQALELPATLDIRGAFEGERAAYEDAQRLAEQGAALATEAGLHAEGLAVADEMTVADTLIRLARELDAPAVVVGAQDHHGLKRLVPSRTLDGLLHGAPCPVLVCGADRSEAA
jgi:nucleotide-binding universal stress UspA family protein